MMAKAKKELPHVNDVLKEHMEQLKSAVQFSSMDAPDTQQKVKEIMDSYRVAAAPGKVRYSDD